MAYKVCTTSELTWQMNKWMIVEGLQKSIKNLLQNWKLVRVTGQSNNYFVFGFITLSFNINENCSNNYYNYLYSWDILGFDLHLQVQDNYTEKAFPHD